MLEDRRIARFKQRQDLLARKFAVDRQHSLGEVDDGIHALGGTRLQRVTIVLGDESKLKSYRDVAEEALRGADHAPRVIDLGLPAEGVDVREDASTCIDATGSHITSR